MGRSVGVAPNSSAVAYIDVTWVGYPTTDEEGNEIPEDDREFDELQSQVDWEHFKENLCINLKEMFPSLETNPEGLDWYGNEGLVLAANNLADVVLYEYCGLASLCLVPKEWDGYDKDTTGLAEAWCGRVAKKFEQKFSELRKVGTFSNGESVYERVG